MNVMPEQLARLRHDQMRTDAADLRLALVLRRAAAARRRAARAHDRAVRLQARAALTLVARPTP